MAQEFYSILQLGVFKASREFKNRLRIPKDPKGSSENLQHIEKSQWSSQNPQSIPDEQIKSQFKLKVKIKVKHPKSQP